ncbi:MAG: 50S ribosomal protein L25/general stress protein Ctc [Pseudomonadota bacterium]|nr:50S ribosomal protein L25/general stress protein Ctc [Pseudomonadota bacterium]
MAEATMAVTARDRSGKGAARAERRAGRVPAVIYGGKAAPVMISVEPRDLQREMSAGNLFSTVYNFDVGGNNERVLPREVQYHPVTDRAQHIDFLRVTADTKLAVEVPCHFINEEECPGLRRGGVLNVVRHAIEFVCRVDDIPNEIEIDLSGLEIGEGVHISMVALPSGINPTIKDRDFTIATIAAPTVVVEETATEGEEGEDGEEGELVQEGEVEETKSEEGTQE